jgi:2-oxoisovalerate dehydrogenase E1 component
VLGSIDTPAIPLNCNLEEAILPNADKVKSALEKLLNY